MKIEVHHSLRDTLEDLKEHIDEIFGKNKTEMRLEDDLEYGFILVVRIKTPLPSLEATERLDILWDRLLDIKKFNELIEHNMIIDVWSRYKGGY